MINLKELLNEDRKKDAWSRHCGFIDLSLKEFQQVQEHLLLEQIDLLSNCKLGQILLDGSLPQNGEEFRKVVPLTSYKDYHPYFKDKQEDVLPLKPSYWVCTSGAIDAYEYKWAPYPQGLAQTHIKNFLASVIFSVSTKKGDFSLTEHQKFLYAMAPPPYLTGMVPYGVEKEFPFTYLPSLATAEKMSFEERNTEGFRLGLTQGIDLFFGVSSVLVRMGEKFAQAERNAANQQKNNPIAWLRLARGLVRSKMKKRELLPRDVWSLKGIICAGTDTSFYKERIEYFWGKKPLEIYGGTEIGIAGTQAWDYEGMTLFPDANYWEFIPENEYLKSKADADYQPKTVLLAELEAGQRYELVMTSFKGGAFVRYRVGDMIRVLRLTNPALGIDLPQVIYEDRIDDVIDLAGFTRIYERTIWEALKEAGITHGHWLACKAFAGGHPIVKIYLEMSDAQKAHTAMEDGIHQALCSVNTDYHNLAEIMAYRPFKLVAVSTIAYAKLKKKQRAEQADPAVFRRINPPEYLLQDLFGLEA
ncbi:MAG: GH3 auxin-responsive promoter family protein [Firmicutes bacterium]|nr:GH3 auxin-responsive promoter family protein [Bacillota bacterium]